MFIIVRIHSQTPTCVITLRMLFILRTHLTISYKLQYTDYVAHIKQYKTIFTYSLKLFPFPKGTDPLLRTNHSLSRMQQVHSTEYIFQYIITDICIGIV